MEVKVVRFSRPLLIRTSWYNDDYQYQTIYGFWLPEHVEPQDPIDKMRMEQYFGYLCGLHCWSSGDGFFTIKDGRWTDETGTPHTKQDEWMTQMEFKCMDKLGLTYEIVTVEVDEDEFRYYVLNEELLVVNEDFYYDIESQEEDDQDDELPF